MWKPEARSSFCEVNLRPENKYKNQSIDFIDITKLSEKQTSVLALEGHKTIENTENFKLRECFSLLRHKVGMM